MKNGISKYTGAIVLAAFLLSACDQKPVPEKINCSKAVSKMTPEEKTQCGKAGDFSKSPEKKW